MVGKITRIFYSGFPFPVMDERADQAAVVFMTGYGDFGLAKIGVGLGLDRP